MIIGTYAAHFNNYWKEFVKKCQNLFELKNFELSQHLHSFWQIFNASHVQESAIGQHFLDNLMCAKNYRDKKFIFILFGRSSFHLSALEAVFIKLSKLNLCRPKEFVYNLKIFSFIPTFMC